MHTTSRALLVAICLTPTFALAANPAANAGADQTIAYGALPALVTLTGSGVDPDGGAITAYSWTTVDVPPGSAASLSSAVVAGPTFTADLPGTYRFCLQVTDDQAETNGTAFAGQPTAACTNITATTQHAALTLPAKGQRNTWDAVNAWATALDTLKGAYDAFVLAVANTGAGSEGAALVGTDTKTNLNNATTVEVALTYLDTILSTTGPYLPLAGGTMTGNVLLGTDNAHAIGSATKGLSALYTRIVRSSNTLDIDSVGNSITLGTLTAADITIGAAAVPTNILGTFQIDSVTLTATATEINQALAGIGATVTGTNLDTLTDASDAAALHTHSTYLPLAGGTMSGDIQWSTDAARTLGSSTATAATVYTRTLSSKPGAAEVAGSTLTCIGGPGGDSAGTGVGGTGGTGRYSGGGGGEASATNAGGTGGTGIFAGGTGGRGSAAQVSGNGAIAYLRGGAAGTDLGGGAGTAGSVVIGDSSTTAVTIGAGGITTTISGTANLPSTWQINSTGVNATAANLNTLVAGTSSNADALHRHAVPALIATDRGAVSANAGGGVSATPVAQWSIPTTALVTVRCTGWCVASAADDAACKYRFTDEAGTTLLTQTLPATECGDTGTLIADAQSFDDTFAASGLGADTFGEVYVVSDSGTSDCKIGRLSCWAY